MPFDGADKIIPEVAAIGKMRELFGPNGEHWAQGIRHETLADGSDAYCMLGAIDMVLDEYEGCIETRIKLALRKTAPLPCHAIETNNDQRTTTFADIRRWLDRAERELEKPHAV